MRETIYQVLHVDHDEIREILEQLACSSGDDALMRFDKQFDLEIELLSHQEAELHILDRRLMDFDALSEGLDTHKREHKAIKEKLSALLALDVTDFQWINRLDELKELVDRHIDSEENQWFPEVSHYLGTAETVDLAKSFKVEKSLRRGLLTRI